jgi:hypothetical protein
MSEFAKTRPFTGHKKHHSKHPFAILVQSMGQGHGGRRQNSEDRIQKTEIRRTRIKTEFLSITGY